MKTTIVQYIINALVGLKVGDTLDKSEFIKFHWERVDWFTKRSFDVAYCTARKKFPTRKFECKDKIITRIT
jgi:hypothetical protein